MSVTARWAEAIARDERVSRPVHHEVLRFVAEPGGCGLVDSGLGHRGVDPVHVEVATAASNIESAGSERASWSARYAATCGCVGEGTEEWGIVDPMGRAGRDSQLVIARTAPFARGGLLGAVLPLDSGT